MIEYSVTLKGGDEQMRKLARYDEISTRHLKRAMSDSAKVVARVARGLAPGTVGGLSRIPI